MMGRRAKVLGAAAALLCLMLAPSWAAAQDANDCSISSSPPSGPTTPLPAGTTVTLTATCIHNPTTYHWSTGATTQSIVVAPTGRTGYVVTGTNSAGTSNIAYTVYVAKAAAPLPTGPVTDPTARVTGFFSAAPPGGGRIHISFTCSGIPTCTGAMTMDEQDSGCSNSFSFSTPIVVTNLDLTHPGALSGVVGLANDSNSINNSNGTCTYFSDGPSLHAYTATWDGTKGAITVQGGDGPTSFDVTGTFTSTLSAPQVFPMTVNATITATVANATAQIQFKPQDVGTSGSVFVFALAPATLVKTASAARSLGIGPVGGLDDAVPCVLAQMGADGQLHAVPSASGLAPTLSNVLSSQGQAVSILNNVPTPNVAGANFFVGYGSTATSMINGGVNQTAVTIPGDVSCQPQVPQTGWWWNPAEGGRGFSIEVQGNNLFFAVFHYDASGRATWNVSPGPVSLGGAFFTSDLYQVTGGQTLFSTYKAPSSAKIGTLTLSFRDAAHGTMTWPGGTIPIERQPFIPGSLAAPPLANQPESGWWWNPDESGRGFFIEWQQDRADIAGYMYDDLGNPVWYISVYPTPDARIFSGSWWTFANGQSMGGAYKPADFTSDHFAPLSITFTSSTTATMQLPNGRSTNLIRQRF